MTDIEKEKLKELGYYQTTDGTWILRSSDVMDYGRAIYLSKQQPRLIDEQGGKG